MLIGCSRISIFLKFENEGITGCYSTNLLRESTLPKVGSAYTACSKKEYYWDPENIKSSSWELWFCKLDYIFIVLPCFIFFLPGLRDTF